MIYNHILIDLSNLFYRIKGNSKNSLDIVKKLINYTDSDVRKYLHKDGTIWVLFDPLSYSDLGSSKAFVNNTERKKILPDYKANRKYSDMFFETIELYRKFYFNRGDKIKLVYSDEYEADDFVSPILDIIKNENKFSSNGISVALLSNDLDFARYIQGREGQYASGFIVDLINKGWEKPYTTTDFFETFKFMPTESAVVLFKALFGDSSDNIPGVISVKKAKFICEEGIKMLCLNFINYINEKNLSIDEVIKKFKTTIYYSTQDKKEKDAFDILYLQFKINDLKLPIMQTLYNNIAIIRSQLEGKNIKDMIHSNPDNEATNSIIYQSIFGISFKSLFGKP